MGFCTNCGNELPEGTSFCPNCGAKAGSDFSLEKPMGNPNAQQQSTAPAGGWQNVNPVQMQVEEKPLSALDKYGKYFGIALLILSMLAGKSDLAILKILLSGGVAAGAVFCLNKKYKLKGFTILALILSSLCVISGISQANRVGLFRTPEAEAYASNSSAEEKNALSGKKKKNEASKKNAAERENKAETIKNEKAVGEAQNRAEAGEKQKETATVNQDSSTAEQQRTEEATENQTQNTEEISGVDPDLKAFLDSYEEFVDEYVDFMKRYNADTGNVVSMLGEYGEMMQKYADFADKIEKYNSQSLSTEDYKYYIEVTTRCSQKMLEVYE